VSHQHPHTHNILKTLQKLRINTPIIWNSNMYYTEETVKLLESTVDIYLGDFRYGSNRCAIELSDAPEYTDIVLRNFRRAYRSDEILIPRPPRTHRMLHKENNRHGKTGDTAHPIQPHVPVPPITPSTQIPTDKPIHNSQ